MMIYGRFDIEPSVVEEGTMSFFWSAVETMKGWYNDGYTVVIGLLIRLAMWLLMLITSKYVLLAMLSPVLALISERTEEILTGHKTPFHLGQLIKDALRGILVASRNFAAELGLLLVIWILTLAMPLIAPITALLSLLISSFYYGFSMLDYINERRKRGLSEGFRFIRERRGLSIALGLGIALGMSVPVIGFIIASFVSVVGAVAAVLATESSRKPKLPPTSEIPTIDTAL